MHSWRSYGLRMMRIDFARRRARGGTGVIPPNTKQWNNEHHALDVRDALALGYVAPLPEVPDVYKQLLPGVTVFRLGDLPVAFLFANHFRTVGRSNWSGLALTMDDGSVLVVYNDTHSPTRVRATLMEEFFHIRLEHPSSALRLLPDAEKASRSYDEGVEGEAFGCAAACLVPYAALRHLVEEGRSVSEIATQFHVSPQLATFRLKVTKLYAKAQRWRRP